MLYRHLANYQRVQMARSLLLFLGTLAAAIASARAGREAPPLLAFLVAVIAYLAVTTSPRLAPRFDGALGHLVTGFDIALVSALVWLSGNPHSVYHLLYYLPILGAGVRLRPRETAVIALLAAGGYLLVLLAHPGPGLSVGAVALGALNLLAPSAAIVAFLFLLKAEVEMGQNVREALHDSLHRFSAVYDVAHAASAGADIGGLLTILLEHATQVTGARSGAIALVQPDRTLRAMATLGQAHGEEISVDATGEAARRALQTGAPVLLDASGHEVMQASPSSVCLPLLSPSGALGVVALAAGAGRFHPKQVDFLNSVCSEAATAVENAQLRADLHRMAVTDYLTGLPNRREMERRLLAEIEAARRYCRSVAVLMIDCDDLKLVNDRCGHACGDKLLGLLAGVLRDSLRAVDSAGRMGGDEFLVLLPEVDENGAAAVASRVISLFQLQAVRLHEGWRGVPLPGLSIGVAATDGTAAASDLLARADAALYTAKNEGKNHFRLASQEGAATSRTPLPLPGPPPP